MIEFTSKTVYFKRKERIMPTSERKREIEDAANKIIANNGLNKPGFDLTSFLVLKENFMVGMQDLEEDTTGLLLVNEHEFIGDTQAHNLIVINSALRKYPDFLKRRRYIAAHEYGHYVLHKKGDTIYAHRDYAEKDTLLEKEADFFARCLLMPRDLVEKTLSAFEMQSAAMEEKISLIARTFNVTEKKARIRLTEDLVGL